jgi:uncharacterized membrane protein
VDNRTALSSFTLHGNEMIIRATSGAASLGPVLVVTACGGLLGIDDPKLVLGTGGSAAAGAAGVLSVGGLNPGGAGTGGNSSGAGVGGAAGTTTSGGTPSSGGQATGGFGAGGTDPCSPNPCVHGDCVAADGGQTCSCALNYFGPTCATARIEEIPLAAALAVDADGNVVVGYSRNAGSSDVFAAQWTPSAEQAQRLSADDASQADAVSGDGLTAFGGIGMVHSDILRWAGGTQNPMGLPVLSGTPATSAFIGAANANGTVVVGTANGTSSRAFRWSTGAGFDAFGPSDSSAYGVSGDGSVVVGSMLVNDVTVAYQWSVGTRTFQELAAPPGWPDCYANNISDNGLVIVGTCRASSGGGPPGPSVAVRWVNGTVYELGQLQSNPLLNGALAANTDGSVILGMGGGSDPWIWDAVNGVRSLTSILEAANGDVSQWSLLEPVAMSADGKTVVGTGGLAGVSGLTAFIARLP